jgi:hypothetical protein
MEYEMRGTGMTETLWHTLIILAIGAVAVGFIAFTVHCAFTISGRISEDERRRSQREAYRQREYPKR